MITFRLSKQLKDLSTGIYPLAAGFDKDPDSVPKIKAKKVALKTLKKEAKRIEKSREERKQYKLAMKQKAKKGSIDTNYATPSEKKNGEKMENVKKPTVQSDDVTTKEKKKGKKDENSIKGGGDSDHVITKEKKKAKKLQKESSGDEQDCKADSHGNYKIF